MTSYERLTLYLAEAKETCRHTQCGQCQYSKYGQNCSICRFAEYLIDNGVIVSPCKVGDTVYAFADCFGVVLSFMVEQIIITYGEKEPLVEYCANCHDNERDELLAELDFEPKNIGETVFLTQEEAEKALKEREKE